MAHGPVQDKPESSQDPVIPKSGHSLKRDNSAYQCREGTRSPSPCTRDRSPTQGEAITLNQIGARMPDERLPQAPASRLYMMVFPSRKIGLTHIYFYKDRESNSKCILTHNSTQI